MLGQIICVVVPVRKFDRVCCGKLVQLKLEDGCFVDDLCKSSGDLKDLYGRRELLRHCSRTCGRYAYDQYEC